jgi:CRP/FNR family transcriptional regulator
MDDLTLSDPGVVARCDVAAVGTSTAEVRTDGRVASSLHVAACGDCRVRRLCLPAQLSDGAVARFNDALGTRRRVAHHSRVFQSGEPFTSLFAIRVGFFKSYAVTEDGATQIMRFAMAGDVLGFDGIGCGRHLQTVEALGYGEVCEIPYATITALASGLSEVRNAIDKALGDAIHRKQRIAMMLGSMTAEARIAAFLLDLAQRFLVRGYSPRAFVLPMTRLDIARHLAVRHETVTRTLTALARDGVIALSGCRLEILDRQRLQSLQRYGH